MRILRLFFLEKGGLNLKKEKLKNQKTAKLSANDTSRKGFRFYCAAVIAGVLLLGCAVPAFAAEDNPLTVVDNLSDFIFGLFRAVGVILLGWGIVQVGMSVQSHDASQRANGLWSVVGGIIIAFTKEILNLITG